jgi:uncharacterized damage-inducible protein DinB
MSTATNILRASLETAAFAINGYLQDLTDEDLLVRPVENANHMAYQLGHLIASEHAMINAVSPGSMPDLPEGFADAYTKESPQSDDPSRFHTKAEYVELMRAQRAGTLAALEQISDETLDRPSPENYREYAPTVGSIFALQAIHWMMHSGQWVIVRRKLGHAPLF